MENAAFIAKIFASYSHRALSSRRRHSTPFRAMIALSISPVVFLPPACLTWPGICFGDRTTRLRRNVMPTTCHHARAPPGNSDACEYELPCEVHLRSAKRARKKRRKKECPMFQSAGWCQCWGCDQSCQAKRDSRVVMLDFDS